MIERITGMIAVVKSERQGRRSIQSVNHRFFKRWFGAPLGASMVGCGCDYSGCKCENPIS